MSRSEPTASGLLRRVRRAQTVARCRLPHSRGVPVFAGARYAEPVASAIQRRFKYRGAPELCGALAALAVRGIDLLGIEPSHVWVPVPLHPLRLAERRWQSSGALGAGSSRAQRTGAAMCAKGAASSPHRATGEAQSPRPNRERQRRVCCPRTGGNRATERARRARRKEDDVVTTGATLGACISALRAAGDEVVGCMAVAYADTRCLPAVSRRAIAQQSESLWL